MIETLRAEGALQAGDEVTGVGDLVDGRPATVGVAPRRPGMPLLGRALTDAAAGEPVVIEREVIEHGHSEGQESPQGSGQGESLGPVREAEAVAVNGVGPDGRDRRSPGGLAPVAGLMAAVGRLRGSVERFEAGVRRHRDYVDRLTPPLTDAAAPAAGPCPRCERLVRALDVEPESIRIRHADGLVDCIIPILPGTRDALLAAPVA